MKPTVPSPMRIAKLWIPTLMFVVGVPVAALCQTGGIVAPGAELKLLADGFTFTEGPAVDRHGNVFFTDQPNDRIMKWSTDGELSVFLSPSGRANGLYFDRDGRTLLAAADDKNELRSITRTGEHSVLVDGYAGVKLNGPNDIWVNPRSGGIYFTDPLYARPYWTHRDGGMQQDGQHVYYLNSDRGNVIRVTDDLTQPNGIVGTPDGKTLYVADIGAGKTYAYDIEADGGLANKRLFAGMGSDGMTIDERGNVYLTGRGVTVFNPAGERIEHIDIPEGWTANLCFGGRNLKTLFITASDSVYTLEMSVKGVR